MLLASNPKGLKDSSISLKDLQLQTLGDEALVIASFECVKISRFAILHIKLWLKEDNVEYECMLRTLFSDSNC